VFEELTIGPYSELFNLFHQFTIYVSKIHLSNIFPPTSRSPKYALPLMVIEYNCVQISTRLTHLILLDSTSLIIYVNLGFEVLTAAVVKRSIFWDLIFTPVSCLAYSSNLRMEATCSSETSVDFQRTARRYIPEDRTLQFT
jgi:hypothetical protein